MRIRAATPADLDALVALEEACWPPVEAYGEEEYVYALRRAHAVNLVAEADRIVGFAGAFLHDGHRVGHVFTLNVHPKARRRGLGRRLMTDLEEAMRAAGMAAAALEVGVGNRAAQALYEGMGYAKEGRIEGYYATGEDAFRMAKRFSPSARAGRRR